MTINIQNLVHALEQKQNSVSSALDVMQISKAIDLLRLNKVFFIENINSLPNVNDVPVGTLYYVETEQGLYILDYSVYSGNFWRSLKEYYSLALGWGSNSSGFLGDGTTTNKCSPVSVVGGFTDWCQVSTGFSHTAAIRTNGTLWSWGEASRGQLGDGTAALKCSPVSVVGGFTDWCQVSVSCYFSGAVRTDGTLWMWGNNCNEAPGLVGGQLGDGTTVNKSSPVSVLGGFTDWCQVAVAQHTVALRTNGSLWSWGLNNIGALGDGTTVTKCSPVSVVGGFLWCQVSAGGCFTVAIRNNGTMWAWGKNDRCQLGDNTGIEKSSPVSVVGGFTDWCQVAAGQRHVAAVRTNGTIWTWGSASSGQLGNNLTTVQSSPVLVVGGFTDWCQVAAGETHTAAVRTNGTLWAWGGNNQGELSDGTKGDRCSPVSVIGINCWNKVFSGSEAAQTFGLIVKDKSF